MTFEELQKIAEQTGWQLCFDNYGQVVFYTGLFAGKDWKEGDPMKEESDYPDGDSPDSDY